MPREGSGCREGHVAHRLVLRRANTGPSKTPVTAKLGALARSRTNGVGLVRSSPLSCSPTKKRLTIVAFSVAIDEDEGRLVPPTLIPNVTTHRCWAIYTPHRDGRQVTVPFLIGDLA